MNDWRKGITYGGPAFQEHRLKPVLPDSGVGRFGGLAEFADHVDEGLDGAGEAAVAAIDEREFAPEVDALDGEEFHFAGFDLIAGEAFADDGDANVGGDEGLDHADARKFHGDLQARAVRTEK